MKTLTIQNIIILISFGIALGALISTVVNRIDFKILFKYYTSKEFKKAVREGYMDFKDE